MKIVERRFEEVPIAEALRNAGLIEDKKVVEKIHKRDKPYVVPAPGPRQGSE